MIPRCGMCGHRMLFLSETTLIIGSFGQGDRTLMAVHKNGICNEGSVPEGVKRQYGKSEDYLRVEL